MLNLTGCFAQKMIKQNAQKDVAASKGRAAAPEVDDDDEDEDDEVRYI